VEVWGIVVVVVMEAVDIVVVDIVGIVCGEAGLPEQRILTDRTRLLLVQRPIPRVHDVRVY